MKRMILSALFALIALASGSVAYANPVNELSLACTDGAITANVTIGGASDGSTLELLLNPGGETASIDIRTGQSNYSHTFTTEAVSGTTYTVTAKADSTVTETIEGCAESPPDEICDDGIDNDGDGQIDEDCGPPPVEICDDGIDNDGDGQIDEDCGPPPVEICDDGIDNDGDGQIDEDCGPPPVEICDDGIDNDGDGQIDEDCGPPPVEICEDGIDNDGDGQIDEGCAPPPVTTASVISIGADCTGSGTLTVSNGVDGATVTLKVTYHEPGSSDFVSTGQTTTVTLADGQTVYPFTINVTSGVPATANTIRIEVQSTSGATFTGQNTKSESFGPCGTQTLTPTPVTPTPVTPTPVTPTPVTQTPVTGEPGSAVVNKFRCTQIEEPTLAVSDPIGVAGDSPVDEEGCVEDVASFEIYLNNDFSSEPFASFEAGTETINGIPENAGGVPHLLLEVDTNVFFSFFVESGGVTTLTVLNPGDDGDATPIADDDGGDGGDKDDSVGDDGGSSDDGASSDDDGSSDDGGSASGGSSTGGSASSASGTSGGAVSALPSTGQGAESGTSGSAIVLLFGAMSLVALVAGFAWRQRRTV